MQTVRFFAEVVLVNLTTIYPVVGIIRTFSCSV